MKGADAFASLHPAVGFLYFALVLAFTMIFMHPAYLAVSLVSALVYYIYIRRSGAWKLCLTFLLPVMLLAFLANPAFSHQGATILAYFPWGNPLTLESIAYGAASAALLGAALLWFAAMNRVMTSDKFVYIFGKAAPALSLLLSMTLRFVPLFASEMKSAYNARRCLREGNGLVDKARLAVEALSAVVSRSLEGAVETADSMKSRGYGLPGRTAFAIWRFDSRDRCMLVWLAFCGMYIISGAAVGGLRWRYYPTMGGTEVGAFPVSFWLVWLILCLTPTIFDIWERKDRNNLSKNQRKGMLCTAKRDGINGAS